MGLEQVKQEVLGKARAEAESIIAEGREEAKNILKEAGARIKEKEKKLEAETKKFTDDLKVKELASANLEAKNNRLQAKKEIVEEVFRRVREEMENMDKAKRTELLSRLLNKAKGEIEVSYVYGSKKDMDILKGLGNFKVDEARIVGGLIAENKQQDIRVDYSFDAMLETFKEKNLGPVGKILFGE